MHLVFDLTKCHRKHLLAQSRAFFWQLRMKKPTLLAFRWKGKRWEKKSPLATIHKLTPDPIISWRWRSSAWLVLAVYVVEYISSILAPIMCTVIITLNTLLRALWSMISSSSKSLQKCNPFIVHGCPLILNNRRRSMWESMHISCTLTNLISVNFSGCGLQLTDHKQPTFGMFDRISVKEPSLMNLHLSMLLYYIQGNSNLERPLGQ